MVVKKKTVSGKSSKVKSSRASIVKKTATKKPVSSKVKKTATPVKKSKSTASKVISKKETATTWFSQPNRPQPIKSPVERKKTPALALANAETVHHVDAKPFWQVDKSFDDRYQLPNHYGETTLALLARDPHWVYAYWELSENTMNELRAQLGDEFNHKTFVLRIYDITFIDFNGSNAHRYFDIDVGIHSSNWYVNLWNDNSSYCVELGARTRDGRFWKIARSNTVQTPRAHPSYRTDLVWMEVEDNKRSNPFIYLTYRKNGKNNGFSKRRRFFLTDEELFAFFARYFQILKQVIGQRWRTETRGLFDDMDIEGVDEYLDDLLDGEDADGITQKMFTGSSEEWQRLLKRRRKKGMRSDLLSVGASENTSSGSWSLAKKEESIRERKFFFELGTELIVYGRTEPDATVTWGGKPVLLRPDGTFSMRFALHDGDVPLDFMAHSINKIDKRQITTSVIRTKTQYK